MALMLAACGGSSPPTAPPTPPPAAGHTVVALLFYDENGDGSLAANEQVRIPDVDVSLGGRSGRSETRTGRAVLTNVPAGRHSLAVRSDTVPPFFAVGFLPSVDVPLPEGGTVSLGLTLPIGGNQPNVYMAFGDSITFGEGLPTAQAYPARLQTRLEQHFVWADVRNRGATGTNTFEALERLERNLRINEPAYTLILYGTNDWHDPVCQDDPGCHTVPNLRMVVQRVKASRSLPFVATLPPVNPALNPAGRNDWIRSINDRIRIMAREEGAVLADVHAAFAQQPDLTALFLDHVHVNGAGSDLIAAAFFEAIAHGR